MSAGDSRRLALAFVERFCSGDVDGLEALLHPELEFTGPLFRFDSRRDYLDCLRADPPQPGGCRVLAVSADPEAAAVFYEYQRTNGALAVAQWFRIDGGRIRETRLVFDGTDLRDD